MIVGVSSSEKLCSKCGQVKSLSYFAKRPQRKSGLRSDCKDCVNARKRARYSKSLETRQRVQERQRLYASQNREREAKRSREWRKKNPKKLRRLNVSYYTRNRESVLAQKAEYHKRKPEIASMNSKKRKARLRGAHIDNITPDQWQEIVDTFNGHCAYCLKAVRTLTIEHVQPIARGGKHSLDNVIPACASCNPRKGSKTLLEFVAFQAREWEARIERLVGK